MGDFSEEGATDRPDLRNSEIGEKKRERDRVEKKT